MDPNNRHLVNAEYQRVISSITGLSTGSLILPLLFLREVRGVPEGASLESYLGPLPYYAWVCLISSVAVCLIYQYVSAKWMKSIFGGETFASGMILERSLDVAFWVASSLFVAGLVLLVYFFLSDSPEPLQVAKVAAKSVRAGDQVNGNIEALLLEEIAKNTRGNSGVGVAAIAAVAALAGALISAVAGYVGISRTATSLGAIEREKLRATIVSSERIRWLQELRARIASFFSHVELQVDLLQRDEGVDGHDGYQESLDLMSKQINTDHNAILMVLDRRKDGQRELFVAMDHWMSFLGEMFVKRRLGPVPRDIVRMGALKSETLDALAEIGRKAWTKVQSLE